MITIGKAAARAGIPAKTIRYYESIGLIAAPRRAGNGYRCYDSATVRSLQLVKRARSLGFSIEECRSLLSLYQDQQRASAEVKHLAQQKVTAIEAKIAELTAMRATLNRLIAHCHGDERPDCSILEDLSRFSTTEE